MSTRAEREENIARVREEREENIARARGEEYTGSSGQGTSAASRGSSGSSAWKKGSIPKGFVKNPLAFAGGIKPVDTRPSVVSMARAPFEYAAQQRQKEAEIQDLNQKYKQAYLDYNSARRAVTAASKGKSTANYDVAKSKMTEASKLVDAYKKRVEEAGGALWTPTNWLDTVKWSARAGLTSADSAIAKGLDWAVGGFADELRTLAGVTANDISPALADSAANLATKAGRLINPNYTYGENNFLKQYVEEGNRRINVQHEEMARAASDSKAAQTVGKYTEMIMNSLPMSAMALLSGGTTAAAQATTEALQAASTLANSSRAAQIVTPILKATTDMAKDPNWGFTFMSVVGDSYENALADGASEDQASLYAILNAAYNATTEIGGSDEMLGGLQKLPKNIRDALERADNSVLLQIVKGIPSEIGEEIVQGIGESGLKSTYKNVPVYSATDEGAMINPSRMKDEALGAAVVSAVLGGGQSAIGAGTYAIENGIAQRQYRNKVAQTYGGSAAELVESGLESAPGTKSRTLAEAYKAKLDSGKSLTPRELTNLVKANEEAIRAESAAEASTVQGTDDTSEMVTSPAQTQNVTEERTPVQTAASTQTAEKAPTGVYEAKYKGQTGDVVAFARQGDSFAMRIKMPDGTRRDVMENQVTLDPATREMLDTVRPYDYGDEILTSYRAAENGDNFKLFTQAFTTVADLYGKETTVTAEQAYADSVKNGGAATVLTREQFNKAFDIGRSSRDARVVNTAARQRGSGNVYFNKVVDFGGERYAAATEDMVSADELSVIKTIAKTAGVDVVFYQSETDMSGRYVGANGFMRNGTMYLDVNAGATRTTEQSAVLLTAAHELTHYIRENNAEGYAQLRDFVTQNLIKDGVNIEKLAEQKIAREDGTLSMDEAVEEVIADSCETMLEDTKFPELMAKENPGLCEQIRDWLADFTEKLRRAFSGVKARHEEARAMLNYAEELHELWDNALVAAVRNTEAVSDNGTEESGQTGWVRNSSRESSTNTTGIKEQIEENRDRLNSMDVVAVATVPTDLGNFDAVTAWAMKELKRTGYAVDKPGFGRIIFDERQIRNGVKYAKTPAEKAAFAVLDKVLKRGVEIGAHGNHKNREKETVTFAAPVELNNIRGNMAVVVNRRGNTYYAHRIVLPDGTEFRFTEKKDAVQGPKRGVTRTGSLAESTSTTSENNIPQPVEESNTKYSRRELDEDLQKRYPQLNLNEDISELDGVPAIELTDGSILPIKDRERYRTHVSFIEGNRIDVDDLRSGGWIGNGVYDASFTSDTARYIERQQAKKRVAELRGVPYDQFDDGNIRYSRRDVGLDDTAEQRRGRQESYADLRRRNAELERRVEYWKGQTRTSKAATVRQTDTDAFARQLMNDAYNSDRETLGKVKDSLKGLGDYIVQSRAEDLDYATIHEIATETADMILQGSYTTIDDTNADNREQLHDYLHSTKLAMNEREMLDLPEGWRQKNRGNIKLSKDGLPVDTAYGELQGMFGEGTFPSDITSQADMLQRIADVERAWRPVKANPFAEYMAEMRENMAQEIIDTMLSDEIRQTPPTAMDRAVARETERVAGERRKNRELQQRIAQVQQEGIERTRKAVQDERRFQLQRQERAQKVKNIEKMITRWAKQLTDNTGKSHIPDALKQPIGQLIRSIDPTTKYTTAKGSAALADRLRRVGDALEKQQKYNMGDTAEGGADVYIDLPPEIGSRLREYAEDIEDAASIRREWKLEDMDLQELAELEDMLTSVRDSLKNANELYSMNMKADALGDETVKYLNKLPAKTKAARFEEKFLGYTNQTPVYFFKRFGTGGEKVFKSLADGWEDFAFKANAIREFAEKLYNSKEVREAEQTIVQVQLHDKLANGLTNEETVPVYMTKAQIMCLYGATLRGEAALNHILGAGIKLTDIKQPRGKDTITQSDNYLTTAEELESIINDNLSERDKEIVRGMIKFMSTTCANWGNAVSQKRWGINLFTEDSYWPISTDSRSRDVKSGEAAGSSTSMYRLANMGFTKPLTPGSTNPMVIGSAFDVFANHTSDMAKYGSMVLPILDAMKWINYSATMETSGTQYTTASVRKAMDRAYGVDAQNYFVKLMRDLNGSKEGGRETNGLETWTARYKRQAVSGNLRVMLLQPTAYARAGMVIDPKYLVVGAIGQHEVIKNYREAIANSGTALWKSMGFYDVNINASMRDLIKNDESAVDKVVDWTMKGAELGDQWTWSMIWRACRTEQQDIARKGREQLTHEELMQRTAERFQEVIYQTQVMDSTLTRSQIMRSDDKLNKALTSFMAEPTLTYNTLSNTYLEYQRLKGAEGAQTAWKKCGGQIARALGVYTVSAALQAVVESIPDAWRDDDEYMTFMEKWLEKFWGEESFLDGNLASELNPLNKLPVIKDLLNALEGHASTNMSTEGLSSAVKFLNTFWDKIQYWLGETDGSDIKVTDWGWIYQGLKAVSQLVGIPGYNIVRDVVGVWNSTFGTWTDMRIRTYAARPESEIKNAYLKGYLTDEEAKELLMDAKTMGDNVYWTEHAATVQINDWANDSGEVYADLYTAMENDDRTAYDAAFKALTDTGRYAYDVQSKVKEQIKEWYAGDKRGKIVLAKEQTIAMLKEFGGMTDHDAKVTAQQWTCKQQEGFDYSQRKKLFLSGDIDKTEAVYLIKTYGVDDDGKLLADYKDKTKANAIAEKEVRKWSMITEQGIDYDDMRDAYNAGEITLAQVKEWSMDYGSEDEKTADNKCYRWEWIAGSEELKGTTGAQARRYDTYIAAANVDMTKEQYYNYIDGHEANTFHADLMPGSTTVYIKYSKRDKAWAYIDSLPITAAQKDALAMCYAADNSKELNNPTKTWMMLEDAPWNN
nr:MAG TPA_asm: hypothetical protein [Caudoviricetes sp.]